MSSCKLTVPGNITQVRVVKHTSAAELARKKGYDTGYAEGFKEGREAGMTKAKEEHEKRMLQVEEESRNQTIRFLEKFNGLYSELDKQLTEHLPVLVMEALKRVSKNHPYTEEEICREVNEILQELSLAKEISIECCAQDVESLKEALAPDYAILSKSALEWKANASLRSGEFIIKSDLGVYDGRHATRISRVEEALKPLFHS